MKIEQRIFTTGYLDQDVRHLPILLTSLNAILIDIRFSPTDKSPQWGRTYLKLLLKDRYRHIPILGNRAEEESEKVLIQNLTLGLRIITELKVNVLLMCKCQTEENCHRRIISQKLKEQGIETREIQDWKY